MRITTKILFFFLAVFIGYILYNTFDRATSPQYVVDSSVNNNPLYKKIVVAGGCFWCTESEYEHIQGVIEAISGYTDSATQNPKYADVSNGSVKAREAVEVIYDENVISSAKILEIYFRHIDPLDAGGQFADRGYQYSPAIYYRDEKDRDLSMSIIKKIESSGKFNKKIAVEVLPFSNFYPAEEYHQNYKEKNPVRYNAYREANGRNAFIRKNWQDDSPYIKDIFGVPSSTSTEIQ